ncbi:MBOAT family O-acyltransferase [Sporocytophaga myxococcoides]|nr:MBOAT family protein [Sporocytophaga myxococcoides]
MILASIIVDYFIVRKMATVEGDFRKYLLGISLILNVGLLAYFKYSNFFVENFNWVLTKFGLNSIEWTAVVLPIGISFFTFQKITYSIDIFRKLNNPLEKISDYILYILLFPHLIAGPIVRYHEIADQIRNRDNEDNANNRLYGFFRFTIGLSKKVLIANVLAEEADKIFALDVNMMSSSTAWIGALAYTFQIYFDFSGYSDMAIGLAKMMGFTFPENFNLPYISKSITEFWRRWHITLGQWMRDYLYIPLGGNRVTPNKVLMNLLIVFLISGLWHGAAWTFILWGAYHGFFLIIDRLFLLEFYQKTGTKMALPITFTITIFGWVLFRANDLEHAIAFIRRMLLFKDEGLTFMELHKGFWISLLIAIFFSFIGAIPKLEQKIENFFSPTEALKEFSFIRYISTAVLLVISASILVSTGFNPFIYFRF